MTVMRQPTQVNTTQFSSLGDLSTDVLANNSKGRKKGENLGWVTNFRFPHLYQVKMITDMAARMLNRSTFWHALWYVYPR